MDFIESANKIYLNPIIELIKNSLFIVILIIVVFYFLRYLLNDVCDKYNKWEQKIKKADESDNTNWECLLISGPWGSGKTTYYKNNYKYVKYKNKSSQPNIYISCFGSSRAELVAQIIRQQFWCNLFTLHGFLGKLVENNWQSFMPKNRVVVFDDLERLHSGKDNYQDLIAVIDYLKVAKECKIILICNLSELRGEDAKIFNMYMERVVDKTDIVKKIFEDNFKGMFEKEIKTEKELLDFCIDKAFIEYANDKINNLRVIKTVIKDIYYKGCFDLNISDEFEIKVIKNYYSDEILFNIHLNYLFFVDYELFKQALDFDNQNLKKDEETKWSNSKEVIKENLQKYHIAIDKFYEAKNKIKRDKYPYFDEQEFVTLDLKDKSFGTERVIYLLKNLPKVLEIDNLNYQILQSEELNKLSGDRYSNLLKQINQTLSMGKDNFNHFIMNTMMKYDYNQNILRKFIEIIIEGLEKSKNYINQQQELTLIAVINVDIDQDCSLTKIAENYMIKLLAVSCLLKKINIDSIEFSTQIISYFVHILIPNMPDSLDYSIRKKIRIRKEIRKEILNKYWIWFFPNTYEECNYKNIETKINTTIDDVYKLIINYKNNTGQENNDTTT